jgi:hypothetical protein
MIKDLKGTVKFIFQWDEGRRSAGEDSPVRLIVKKW